MLKKLIAVTLMTLATAAGSLMAQAKESGMADAYNDSFHGKATASGEKYDKTALTAAHKTLPFGTKVRVTRPDTKKSVVVRINDRGAFGKGMVIDLSRKAADALGVSDKGQTKVNIEVIDEDAERKAADAEKNKNAAEGLYKIQVLKIEPKNDQWGVQIAVYSSYDGVLRHVSELQDDWFKNIMVYVTGEAEKAQYKVVLGPFLDKATAESYQQNVKKKHKINGQVIALFDLKKAATAATPSNK